MKLHFLAWFFTTVLNTIIVLSESKKYRMLLLVGVLTLQHLMLLLFMVDYENLGSEKWKDREAKLRKEIEKEQERKKREAGAAGKKEA
jgi:hypothetical protein